MQTDDDIETLRIRLNELQIEHRDLDQVIAYMLAIPPQDELLLRRMKKRKLQVKDRITLIEGMLEPDVPA